MKLTTNSDPARRRWLLAFTALGTLAVLLAVGLGGDSAGSPPAAPVADSASLPGGDTVAPPPAPFSDRALRRLDNELGGLFRRLGHRTRVSTCLMDPATGQVLFEHQADHALVPASNMKVMTAGAALSILGPEHRFETRFRATAPVVDGVLRGDLIVSGVGDPTLSSRFFSGEPLAPMLAIAKLLRETGLQRIEGRVLADGTAFTGPSTGPNWPRDPLWQRWMVEVSALAFNDNQLDVVCHWEGSRPAVSLVPDVGVGVVRNRLEPVSSRSRHSIVLTRPDDANRFTVSGRLWRDTPRYEARSNVHDGDLYFAAALKRALEVSGVPVGAGFGVLDAPPVPSRLHDVLTYTSTLSRSLRPMLKVSQNLYAELLFRVVGRAAGEEGSFAGGSRAIIAWLEDRGIREPATEIADGSGLSRANKVSARQFVRLLAMLARDARIAVPFRDALAIPGETGTLAKRMTDLRDSVRAKTGTLSGTSALSGYVRHASGRWLAFSLLFNRCDVGAVRGLQDHFCRTVVHSDLD